MNLPTHSRWYLVGIALCLLTALISSPLYGQQKPSEFYLYAARPYTEVVLKPTKVDNWKVEIEWKSNFPDLRFELYYPNSPRPSIRTSGKNRASLSFNVTAKQLASPGDFVLRIVPSKVGQRAKGTVQIRSASRRKLVDPTGQRPTQGATPGAISTDRPSTAPAPAPTQTGPEARVVVFPDGRVRYIQPNGSYREVGPKRTTYYDAETGQTFTNIHSTHSDVLSADPPVNMPGFNSPDETAWATELNAWLKELAESMLIDIKIELQQNEKAIATYQTYESANASSLYQKFDCRYRFLKRVRSAKLN